jgi:predicted transcriptional regulator
MTTYRNVTLSLPTHVLRQLKRIAARRQTSISKLATEALEEIAAREDEYAQARAEHLAWLAHAADLGTQGQITWSRESLHER